MRDEYDDDKPKRPTLEELQAANLPKATPADVGIDFTDTTTEELRATLTEYFGHFVGRVDGKFSCPCCAGTGTFTWGIAHGEGHCTTCGWPHRAYHFIKDKNGEQIMRHVTILAYHPSELSRRETA